MASVFAKRGELWLGWIEYQNGKKIHPQVPLALKDTKVNRRLANELKKNKEYEYGCREKIQETSGTGHDRKRPYPEPHNQDGCLHALLAGGRDHHERLYPRLL